MVEEIIKIKEEANEFFKSGDHEQAIKLCNSVRLSKTQIQYTANIHFA